MEGLAGYIATGVISLIVGLVLRSLEARPKVVFWQPHYALFEMPNQKVKIQTDSITIQNLGRQTAENVEIIFKAKPDHFMLTPSVAYKEEATPRGNFLIRLESLGAKEFVTLHLLSSVTTPHVEFIRSKAGPAEQMPFQMQRIFPRWVNLLSAFFLFAGVGFVIYWLIKAILCISRNIGVL